MGAEVKLVSALWLRVSAQQPFTPPKTNRWDFRSQAVGGASALCSREPPPASPGNFKLRASPLKVGTYCFLSGSDQTADPAQGP